MLNMTFLDFCCPIYYSLFIIKHTPHLTNPLNKERKAKKACIWDARRYEMEFNKEKYLQEKYLIVEKFKI